MAAFCRRNQRHRPLEPTLAEQIEVQQGLECGNLRLHRSGQYGHAAHASIGKLAFLPGISPLQEDQPAVAVDHLNACIALQDQLHWQSDGRFVLGPRTSDLIKIGGKRGSLAQITALIQQHPQVSDAYVFVSTGRLPRLMALVCGQVAAHALKHHIAEHCDDVFVPRQIRFAPSYRAIQMAKSFTLTPFGSWRRLEPQSSTTAPEQVAPRVFQRQVQIPLSTQFFNAHFPGQPLLPAALILAWLSDWLAHTPLASDWVKSCKFMQPIRPGDALNLVCTLTPPSRLQVKLMNAQTSVVEGHFILATPHVE